MDQCDCDQTAWTGQSLAFLNGLMTRLQKAKKVSLIISFIRESGVRLLVNALQEIDHLEILTGTYLQITEPWALRHLKEECPQADIRLYNHPEISFHPKAWIFYYDQAPYVEVIIGSSNLSQSALIQGVEWNCALQGKDTQVFVQRFEELFNEALVLSEEVLEDYRKTWTKPPISFPSLDSSQENSIVRPRHVQIEALYALKALRENGGKKGLVQAATGIGKTFLAAFDAKPFKRILFVAHREEILNQASEAFQAVMPNKTFGFLTANRKDWQAEVVFASVFTLAQEKWLHPDFFAPEAFDYIVIDEFHHAIASSYQRIVQYFKPQFLLGLTATPDRLDRRDVYALCDYNIPYAISLQEAINKGILAPFSYYGIYDSTDYSSLSVQNGQYMPRDLEKLYVQNGQRMDLILGHFQKHHPKKALGFCTTKGHAQAMAEAFIQAGIPAMALYSQGPYSRQECLQALKEGTISVLFCVDMLNEGLDIPSLDLIMMLRPTKSPTIFLQQLGRGLRLDPGKERLIVLDFIGNYIYANRLPALLLDSNRPQSARLVLQETQPPLNCFIDFDLRLVQLFDEMEKRQPFKMRFVQAFEQIQHELGHRPSRVELFTLLEADLLDQAIKLGSKNPLLSYFDFLHQQGSLSLPEENLYRSQAQELLHFLETTSMTRIYKMPVLQSFVDPEKKKIRSQVSQNELLKTWKAFFAVNENWKDLPKMERFSDFLALSDTYHWATIKKNPVHYLASSSQGMFQESKDMAAILQMNEHYWPWLEDELFIAQWRDILEVRILMYFRTRYYQKLDA